MSIKRRTRKRTSGYKPAFTMRASFFMYSFVATSQAETVALDQMDYDAKYSFLFIPQERISSPQGDIVLAQYPQVEGVIILLQHPFHLLAPVLVAGDCSPRLIAKGRYPKGCFAKPSSFLAPTGLPL